MLVDDTCLSLLDGSDEADSAVTPVPKRRDNVSACADQLKEPKMFRLYDYDAEENLPSLHLQL